MTAVLHPLVVAPTFVEQTLLGNQDGSGYEVDSLDVNWSPQPTFSSSLIIHSLLQNDTRNGEILQLRQHTASSRSYP